MSRPQYSINAPASHIGQVVNGGLIDFQDNFHRGLAEYANYMASQQQQQTLMGGFPGQAQQLMPGVGYPAQLQQAQQSMAFQPLQQQQVASVSSGGPHHLPCISGPPAYVHINGQTYVPVDSSPQISSSVPSKPAAVETTPSPVEPVSAAPRALSNEDIDRRVHEQVEAWASRQRKPISYQQEPVYDNTSSRQHLKGRAVSDEDRAAERVSSVNAGMRGRFRSPF